MKVIVQFTGSGDGEMEREKATYRLDYHGEGDDVPGLVSDWEVRLMLEDCYGKAGALDVLDALRWGRRVHVRPGVLFRNGEGCKSTVRH
jgi:hypothetical protein